ncbi:MAG: hypothetical protein FJ077_13805 [Cyanobacteria bacterium K_DeepCast_35m_m2_023]|nr:hypothetical protein [Cyanobacteria bacterium K_DeepCast_35m_m2_023]
MGLRQGDSLGSGVLIQIDQCPLAVLTNKHVLPYKNAIELMVDGQRLNDLPLSPVKDVFPAGVDAEWVVVGAAVAKPAVQDMHERLRQRAFRSNQLAAMPPLYAGAPSPVRAFGYRYVGPPEKVNSESTPTKRRPA